MKTIMIITSASMLTALTFTGCGGGDNGTSPASSSSVSSSDTAFSSVSQVSSSSESSSEISTVSSSSSSTASSAIACGSDNDLYTILKTGQSKVYKDKDDGSYQIGLDRCYTRDDANQIVTDETTGLKWQDDVASETMDWESAGNYCLALRLGDHTDWRLPTDKELLSIVSKQRANPAVDPVFQNYDLSSAVWSSTTYADSQPYDPFSWYVSFTFVGYSNIKSQTDELYVRCVRGEDRTNFGKGDFSPKGDGTVYDELHHLQWQDDDDVQQLKKTWSEAIDYCESLTLGGYPDWRLPNYNEYLALVYRNKRMPALSGAFNQTTGINTWTSTTSLGNTDYALYFSNNQGYVHWRHKETPYTVRCVRGGMKP